MGSFKLSRRAVLKGTGVAVALPFLEVMLDSSPAGAQSAQVPKRFLLCAGGHSLCGGGGSVLDHVIPTKVGAGYDLKTAYMPLTGVQNEVAVVSGLRIPSSNENAGMVPAAGKPVNFHGYSEAPLLTGVRTTDGGFGGVTSDQIAVELLAGNTTFKSLAFRVQASHYVGSSGSGGGRPLSWTRNSNGRLQSILPTVSPRQAFQSLFGNFTAGLSQAELEKQQFALDARLSILDRVKDRADALSKRLGGSDRRRLENHLEQIRELELRVAAMPPEVQGVCSKPADPGEDPAVGGGQSVNSEGNITYQQNLGYSGEEQRARAFCDLIHMAVACDLTRVATLQFTLFQSFLNMVTLTGQKSDLHQLSHGAFGNVNESTALAMARGIAWHMKHFAYLIERFRDTPEVGGRMLDNMAIVYVNEGGHGNDPSSSDKSSPHSTENMAALVAGGVGRLKAGHHVPAPGMHPAHVLLTALRALGYTENTFGEVTGEIPGLRA
ncbi:MAG: DUF1552 domain-containing protein [Myxococcaceae bacterium]